LPCGLRSPKDRITDPAGDGAVLAATWGETAVPIREAGHPHDGRAGAAAPPCAAAAGSPAGSRPNVWIPARTPAVRTGGTRVAPTRLPVRPSDLTGSSPASPRESGLRRHRVRPTGHDRAEDGPLESRRLESRRHVPGHGAS